MPGRAMNPLESLIVPELEDRLRRTQKLMKFLKNTSKTLSCTADYSAMECIVPVLLGKSRSGRKVAIKQTEKMVKSNDLARRIRGEEI